MTICLWAISLDTSQIKDYILKYPFRKRNEQFANLFPILLPSKNGEGSVLNYVGIFVGLVVTYPFFSILASIFVPQFVYVSVCTFEFYKHSPAQHPVGYM